MWSTHRAATEETQRMEGLKKLLAAMLDETSFDLSSTEIT